MSTTHTTRQPFSEFIHDETVGGVVLLAAVVVALLWANLAPASYQDVWSTTIGPSSPVHLNLDLHSWVNDGLMAIFFFVVGLEIKRELVGGELASPRAAAMPALAALGGMAVPALIYLAFNQHGAGRDGWAIPMATDIAFVLAALSLLGRRIPSGLRLFILAVAIVDDLGAIIVIAVFYSNGIDLVMLAGGGAVILGIVAMRRLGVSTPVYYAIPAVALWLLVHGSGVHATIAGVVMGLITPARPIKGKLVLKELEHRLHPLSAFIVVPLFALANAGVLLDADTISAATSSTVAAGIVAGLIVGKTVGITGVALLARRIRIGMLPDGVGIRHLVGGATLAGIGFTVALFNAELSFAGTPLLDEAKLAILGASVLAACLGSVQFVAGRRTRRGLRTRFVADSSTPATGDDP